MPNATLELLLARNRIHAARVSRHDAEYFSRHEAGQAPRCLWIGCADSRVPVDTLVQASPGELFVMRNVANQVLAEDDSIMSGIEYALNTLRVDTVIICGHTHCGGVDFAGLMAVVPGEEKKISHSPDRCSLSARPCASRSNSIRSGGSYPKITSNDFL
ncbi:carbonic anhydrase [Enterobacter sp. CFBP8995]|nr:carbonic anhydrase [Enterobacter sp. CFBP8995]